MFFAGRSAGADAFVLGVDDDGASRQAVREAAELAWREGATLHLVVAYVLHDSWTHRAARVNGPCDVAYQMSPKADAALVVHELAAIATRMGVEVVEHVHRGSLKAGVRQVTRELAKAPAPARVPAARPVPVPVPAAAPARARVSPPRFVRAVEPDPHPAPVNAA